MAPQKHLAVSANTNQVFSPEHRGICTALRCEPNTSAFLSKGKHPFPPSLRHKETVPDKDADTSLGRALQNEGATRQCVAERHTAVRSACWSLTPAAGEFAAAKTTLNRPIASAKAKARLDTRRVPGPGPSLCAKATPRTRYTRSARTRIIVAVNNMPNPFFALGLCTRANSYQEKWGRHHFVPLYSIARAPLRG